jgi:hypothetical protein
MTETNTSVDLAGFDGCSTSGQLVAATPVAERLRCQLRAVVAAHEPRRAAGDDERPNVVTVSVGGDAALYYWNR